jgi:diaminopimelate epimerase
MTTLAFTKYQGIGNDFVIVDNRPKDGTTALDGLPLKDLARKLCDRNFGIGADGLIIAHPSNRAAVRMQILNSDGSEPEMCGNGIRCLARFLWENTPADQRKDVMSIETLAGIKVVALIVEENELKQVEVDMGEPVFEDTDEEVLGADAKNTYCFRRVSMGNPHAVIFLNNFDNLDLAKDGAKIETDPKFPKSTNVEFVTVQNRKEITVKVWERGAGITLACGTGACATVVASVLKDLTDRTVTVHLPGGDLEIEWDSKDNRVCMRGPAEKVFTGNIEV